MAAMTWSDNEESGSEEEAEPKEVANLCLMAHEEDNEVSTSNSSQFTLNELQDTFNDFFFNSKRWKLKTVFSKRLFLLFPNKMRTYKKNKIFKNKVCILKEKVK